MWKVWGLGRFALVAGLAVGLSAITAEASSVLSWKGSATGTTRPGVVAGASGAVDAFGGNATPFGGFTGAGFHVLNPFTGHFAGTAVWSVSRTDSLRVTYTGDLTPSGNPAYPYGFKGVLTAQGGTGRFAKAKGSAVWMGGFTGSPGSYFFVFDGTLENIPDLTANDNYKLQGSAGFANILQGTQLGGLVPYNGVGQSRLTGANTQTGTIRNLSGLVPIDGTTFVFLGEVGPHPTLPGSPSVHLISTDHGKIVSHWTAVFTLKVVDANGGAIFSGDGDFQVLGGTGRFQGASGRFRTFFETGTVPHGADQANARVEEMGTIRP